MTRVEGILIERSAAARSHSPCAAIPAVNTPTIVFAAMWPPMRLREGGSRCFERREYDERTLQKRARGSSIIQNIFD